MALVKCPECGKENISEYALSCPECGFTIAKYFEELKEAEKNLVDCPECGKENISKLLEECPECGSPIASHFSEKTVSRVVEPQNNSSFSNNAQNISTPTYNNSSTSKIYELWATKKQLIIGLSIAAIGLIVLLSVLLRPKTPLQKIVGSWHSTGASVNDNYYDEPASFATLIIKKDGTAVSRLGTGQEITFTVREETLPGGVNIVGHYFFTCDNNTSYKQEIIYFEERDTLSLSSHTSDDTTIIFERD